MAGAGSDDTNTQHVNPSPQLRERSHAKQAGTTSRDWNHIQECRKRRRGGVGHGMRDNKQNGPGGISLQVCGHC